MKTEIVDAFRAARNNCELSLIQIAFEVAIQDRPITGELAANIWELTSRDFLPAKVAARFMRDCGYEPFAGYPLTRI